MSKPQLSPGATAACGRLDSFVRLTGKDIGRWMIEVAERLATKGRCQRTLKRARPRSTQK